MISAEAKLLHDIACKSDNPLTLSLVAHSETVMDLVWALHWLEALVSSPPDEMMSQEFLEDLKKRRKKSNTLDCAAKEVYL